MVGKGDDVNYGRLVWWRPLPFRAEMVGAHYWRMGQAPSDGDAPPTNEGEAAERELEHERFKKLMERDYTLTRDAGPGSHAPLVTGLFACAPFWVTLRLVLSPTGALELGSIEIQAQSEGSGDGRERITKTGILKDLPLPKMLATLKTLYGEHLWDEFPDGMPEDFGAPWIGDHPVAGAAAATGLPPMVRGRVDREVAKDAERREAHPGRPLEHDRSFYEAVADAYTNAPENPTATVAQGFQVSHSTAAKWVRVCRSEKYRLLPETTRGTATR